MAQHSQILNQHSESINIMFNKVNENTKNNGILNERTISIGNEVFRLNNFVYTLGTDLVRTNERMDQSFEILKSDIERTYDVVGKDIVNTYNNLHNVLQTEDKMNKVFNMI